MLIGKLGIKAALALVNALYKVTMIRHHVQPTRVMNIFEEHCVTFIALFDVATQQAVSPSFLVEGRDR